MSAERTWGTFPGTFLLVIAGCGWLLFQLAQDDVWALAAHAAYGAYIVTLIGLSALSIRRTKNAEGLSLSSPYSGGRTQDVVLIGVWVLLPPLLIVAAYVPSGWNLWNRTLLVALVTVLTWDAAHANRLPIPRLLTVCITVALTVFVTYAIDRSVGLATGGRAPGGLVFPRNSSVSYQTPEFAYTVRINRYGFRGPNFNLDAPVGCRVMLLGDSFTYGWGVDYAQTWGALLEDYLRAADFDAQVLNMGVPGGNVPDYAALADVAAPILQPDVILVGVLQGDDMRQMSREAASFPRAVTFGDEVQVSPLTEYLTFHYPFIAERTVLSRISAASIKQNWQHTAQQFRQKYEGREEWQSRYVALPDEIRTLFEAGDINPHFLDFAVVMPDYWAWALQDPDTLTPYIADMSGYLQQIVEAAPNAQTVILSVPHGAYTQPEARDDLEYRGFIVPPEIVESSLVDDAIEQAANMAGVPFVKVTEVFRQHAALAFYPIDGHFNAEGNRRFAEAIAPSIIERCGG